MRALSFTLALNLLLAGTALGVAEGDMAPDFWLPVLGGESDEVVVGEPRQGPLH